MSAANTLILTDLNEEEKADDIMAALSEMAYATPSKNKVVAKKERRFKSRFFFVLSDSIANEVGEAKRRLQPKKLDYIDDEIEARLKALKKVMPKELEAKIEAVREFFLTEIGPRSLAGGAGSVQAKAIVERMLNSPIDGTQFAKFERMSHEAVNMKMAKFIAKFYDLPQSATTKLLESVMPRQPVIFPIGAPNERNPEKDKKADST